MSICPPLRDNLAGSQTTKRADVARNTCQVAAPARRGDGDRCLRLEQGARLVFDDRSLVAAWLFSADRIDDRGLAKSRSGHAGRVSLCSAPGILDGRGL